MQQLYSQDRAARFPLHLAALRAGEQPAPIHVYLSISDLCNQDCGWCLHRASGLANAELFADPTAKVPHNPTRQIDTARALAILDDCAAMGVRAVELTGGGEPTAHPDIETICQAVLDRGMELGLVTNGVRMTAELAEVLRCAAWVRVSIDAGTPQTYSRTRGVSEQHWSRAWTGVRLLTRTRPGPTVGVSFVVSRENWREVFAAGELAREAGAANFRIAALYQAEGERYFDGWGREAEALCQATEALARSDFHVYNLFRERIEHMRPPDYRTCYQQHFAPYIGADLNVYRCCNTSYTRRGLVGSLQEQSFRSLWASAAKQRDFEAFDARGCGRCLFDAKNRRVAELLRAPRSHDCFV